MLRTARYLLSPLGVALVILAGCSQRPTPTAAAANAVADPTCGLTALMRDDAPPENELLLRPSRITPNGNGVDDYSQVSLAANPDAPASLHWIREGDCKFGGSTALGDAPIHWGDGGPSSQPLESGRYLLCARSAKNKLLAVKALVVAEQDDPCAVADQYQPPGAGLLQNSTHRFADYDRSVGQTIRVSEPGWLCLSLQRHDKSTGWADVRIDDQPVFSARAMAPGVAHVMRAVPITQDALIQLEGRSGEYSVSAGFVPEPRLFASVATEPTAGVVENLPAQIVCSGRLVSPRHPFGVTRQGWPGLTQDRYPQGRRPITRAGVPVYCSVSLDLAVQPDQFFPLVRRNSSGGAFADLKVDDLWDNSVLDVGPLQPDLPPGGGGGSPYESFTAEGVTDINGEFRLTIDIPATSRHRPLVRRYANCRDVHASCTQQYTFTADPDVPTDIWDVADLSFSTGIGGPDGPVEAFLLTNAGSEPQTQASMASVVETLASTPGLVRRTTGSLGPTSPERVSVVQLPAMNDLPLVIHEPFDPLDEDSLDYGVWLLGGQPMDLSDSTNGDLCEVPPSKLCFGDSDCSWTPSCSADSWPVQCRSTNVLKVLLDAGYDIWFVDHGRKSSVARAAPWGPILYQNILRMPHKDVNRQLAVAGLSSGAVVARMSLLLWQRQSDLATINQRFGTDLFIHQSGQLSMPFARVAAYLSFDGPHRGARIPVSVQAYLNDDHLPINNELVKLIGAEATKELLYNYVDSDVDTKCFRSNSFADGVPRSCTVTPADVDASLISDAGVANLLRLTRDILDRPLPGRSRADGLPNNLPNFGISNASRAGADIVHDTDEVLYVEIKKPRSNRKQRLKDTARQPAGSQYPNMCRAYTLGKPTGRTLSSYSAAIDDCDAALRGGPLCVLIGGFDGLITGILDFFGVDNLAGEISIEPDVPMRFPSFISAESALLAPGVPPLRGSHATGWQDALWSVDGDRLHFDVTDEACKFIRYHLDGVMMGDKDGLPVCASTANASCADGGMQPGPLIATPELFVANRSRYCEG